MTVAELLSASRAAHAVYRDNAGRVHSDGSILTLGDRNRAYQAVQTAADCRQQANDADPTHSDPEWLNDPAPDADLSSFYARFLSVSPTARSFPVNAATRTR